VQTLVALIRAAMSGLAVESSTAMPSKHSYLRATALADRARQKALQYLKLRELPSAGVELIPGALLRREQSKAYKR